MKKTWTTFVLAVLLAAGGCDEEGSGRAPGEGEGEGEGPAEGEGEGAPSCDGSDRVVPEKPAGHASIWLLVDDSLAKTYRDGDLKWNGSFVWEEATNTVAYSAAWLPEHGPFPVLRDDGPISCGGHEPEGQAAGDNVHSVEVWVDASAGEVIFEYGVINEADNWIWVGPNGQVTVPEGSTDRLEADGLGIAGFGDYDLKITLDSSQLDPDVYPDGLPSPDPKVYLKGTMSNWANVLLFDDGERGDAAAGDGVFTYVQSERLGDHEGLLAAGQRAQLVWVHLFDPEGDAKTDGREYKATSNALPAGVPTLDEVPADARTFVYASPAGVAAWSKAKGGSWRAETVALALESRGATWNTTVEVSPGEGEGEGEGPAEGVGEGAAEGEGEGSGDVGILMIDPDSGPLGGNIRVAIHGQGFAAGATVTFGGVPATDVEFVSAARLNCTTPAHAAGVVDVVVDVAGDRATYPDGFTYEEGGGGGIDLTIDGNLLDWDDAWPSATNTVGTDWGEGNRLQKLRAVTDGETLYIAVEGTVEASNVIIGYVDIDAGGAGTGVRDMSTLTDDVGAVDAALSSIVTVTANGVGAEYGFGVKGMSPDTAGWRSLSPADDFDWLDGPVAIGGGGTVVETSFALPQGTGDRIAIGVRIANETGEVLSNQTLPEDGAGGAVWSEALFVDVPAE